MEDTWLRFFQHEGKRQIVKSTVILKDDHFIFTKQCVILQDIQNYMKFLRWGGATFVYIQHIQHLDYICHVVSVLFKAQ